MFHHVNDHEVVSRLAEADRCLILELVASHGLEFATAFRIDFATEVAKAMWSVANKSAERRQ